VYLSVLQASRALYVTKQAMHTLSDTALQLLLSVQSVHILTLSLI